MAPSIQWAEMYEKICCMGLHLPETGQALLADDTCIVLVCVAHVNIGAHTGHAGSAGVLPHAKGKRRFGLILRLGLALVFGVSRQPHVVRLQLCTAHVEEGTAEPQTGVQHGVHAPAFHRAQHVSCQVGQRSLAQRLLHLVLDVHGHRHTQRFAGQSAFQQGQLLIRLCLVDGLKVAIHTHRDAQPCALGVVAGKLRVNVRLACLAVGAVAHGADHDAADLAGRLDLCPVNRALMAAHVHDGFFHAYSSCTISSKPLLTRMSFTFAFSRRGQRSYSVFASSTVSADMISCAHNIAIINTNLSNFCVILCINSLAHFKQTLFQHLVFFLQRRHRLRQLLPLFGLFALGFLRGQLFGGRRGWYRARLVHHVGAVCQCNAPVALAGLCSIVVLAHGLRNGGVIGFCRRSGVTGLDFSVHTVPPYPITLPLSSTSVVDGMIKVGRMPYE
nr:MAG TPA: hypothetical protein [Bacteriophage sp.]